MKGFARALALVACAAGLWVIVTIGMGLWRDYSAQTRGIALGANKTSIAIDNLPPLGINADLRDEPPASRPQTLALLHDGGFRLVRQPFPWREIEPAKGVFQWDRWDSLVRDYRDHDLEIIAVLSEPPSWSRQDNNWVNRPPDNLDDFGDFVAAFAARYRGQIGYLQIWDEPNVFPNWGNRAVDPAGYAALLASAYRRAKQANPGVAVLLAGLAPNGEPGGRNMSDLQFLADLYAAGASDHFDVAAAKPYGLWYSPEDREVNPDRMGFGRVVQWREVMVAHGDTNKPLWAVEFGWNSLPADWSGAPSSWGRVTPEEQASCTLAAVQRARAEWPWLPVLILQGHFPSLPAGDARLGFDIVDGDGRPKPVYETLKRFAAQASASVGLHTLTNDAVSLSGPWRIAGGAGSGAAGATLLAGFTGSRLDLLISTGPNGAVAQVSIDGRPAPRLTKVDGAAWLDTRSRLERRERITVADGLAGGPHTLQLSVKARHDLWPLARDAGDFFTVWGIDVVREPNYGSLPWQAPGLGLAGLLLLFQIARFILRWPWLPLARLIRAGCGRAARCVLSAAAAVWSALGPGQRDVALLAAVLALVGTMYAAPPQIMPLLLAVAVAFIRSRPVIGAYALIASAPFGSLLIAAGEARYAPAEILAVCAALALASRLTTNWPKLVAAVRSPALWLKSGFNGPIVLLVLAGSLSAVMADYQSEAWRELRTVIVEPTVMYFVVVAALAPGESSRRFPLLDPLRLVDALVIVGVIVAAIGLYQYLFTSDVITAEGVYRLRALYGSPNNVGLLLGRVVPIAGCVLLVPGRRRIAYLAALVAILAAVTLTFSLGAWLGIGAAAIFVWALGGFRARFRFAAAASVIAGAIILLPTQRLMSHLTLSQGTTAVRLLVWQSALNMLRDHPLFGVGPDNFLRHYRDQYILADAWREPNLSHPHNIFFDFLLRTGLAGLLVGGLLLVSFFGRGIRLLGESRDLASRMLTLGLLASMVDFAVHGLVDNSLFLTDLGLVFWLTCGLLEVLRRRHYNKAAFGEEA